jgi:hypothetical protein
MYITISFETRNRKRRSTFAVCSTDVARHVQLVSPANMIAVDSNQPQRKTEISVIFKFPAYCIVCSHNKSDSSFVSENHRSREEGKKKDYDFRLRLTK